MISRRRDILLNALKLFDMAVVVLAFGLATVPTSGVGHTISMADFLSMRVKVGNCFIFLGLIILWHALFSMCGLYASRRLSGRIAEVTDVMKATSLGTLCLAGASLLFHIRMATPAFVVVFWALQHPDAGLQQTNDEGRAGANPVARTKSSPHADRGEQCAGGSICR